MSHRTLPSAALVSSLLSLAILSACGDDDSAGAGESGNEGTASGGDGDADTTAGDGDATGGDGDAPSGEIAFTVSATGDGLELPPITGSFVLAEDDGSLYYNVRMSDMTGTVLLTLRREGDAPWEPGTYTPELLTIIWLEEDVTCSFSPANADGRELTVELTSVDPGIGSFEGEGSCGVGDERVIATLSGTFDDS